jgi:hypothetical protein
MSSWCNAGRRGAIPKNLARAFHERAGELVSATIVNHGLASDAVAMIHS